ncbi:MAG: hypothetical protein CVV05_00155 [Gammaproteobacteria bacterium HGW-Gammaproteobacteria-1]|jgi:hypothetical protein|nr:MAG: hypothetical protein CVV05_00155 [Gammaproteobacteria bacterium HGW-Gammaproteobacteria-1]
MATSSIHQAIHGYRDGHRLLSSSTPLPPDAVRTMLVLSDMSGPSMQPGFDKYLTAYPLPGTELFVLARTWYAPEMQRPGCVWTHSLLIPRSHVTRVPAASLLGAFRRPQLEGVESAATIPVEVDETISGGTTTVGFADRGLAALIIGAVLGQPRPVIVVADTADQFEGVFVRLWEELWPTERTRFSFCTGALMPRASAGALLDLQTIPRSIPSAQFRKSASSALILDLRTSRKTEPWVDVVLDGASRGDATFRTWIESAAGAEGSRAVVPSLAPIFGEWHAPGSSARSALSCVTAAKDLDPGVRSRLIGMVFERANTESGASGRREILQDICGYRDNDIDSIAAMLEGQTRRLFEDARTEGVRLVIALLSDELTAIGERMLRAAVLLLEASDLESFDDAQLRFLPTIVGANHHLASSPVLWGLVGSRSEELLGQLESMNLNDEERSAIADAILSSGRDVAVEAFVRFGGKAAVFQGLSAIASGQIHLSWPWRSVLGSQRDTVIEWLESLSTPSLDDLELGSRVLTPKVTRSRLVTVWKAGTVDAGPIASRIAAFGLSLAFWEHSVNSPLFAVCFQPTYDAAGNSRLEYDEWEWMREYAPSLSYWRDWDRCERLAKAIARLFAEENASLETVFGIVHSPQAVKKVADMLDDDRNTCSYLKTLRKSAEFSSIGSHEQRTALLKGW